MAKSKILTKAEIEALRQQARETMAEVQDAADTKARLDAATFSQKNVRATRNEMANTVNEKIKWLNFSQMLKQPKSDEEVWQRICNFWDICSKSGEVPQKTDFYMYLGVTPMVASNWRNGKGCSKERADMMAQFDLMYDSVRDSLSAKGLINQIAAIWQSKQWQGYSEPVKKIDITNNNPMSNFPDSAAIEQKYQDLLIETDKTVEEEYLTDVNEEATNV